jgi:hypothetical protein
MAEDRKPFPLSETGMLSPPGTVREPNKDTEGWERQT